MSRSVLPKGCSNIKLSPTGGTGRTQKANRMYMLTVQRESLLKKRHTLEVQMKEIQMQLKTAEREILSIGNLYAKELRPKRSRTKDSHGHKKIHFRY